MSWTDEKVAKLKELWGKGNTASQIAEIIVTMLDSFGDVAVMFLAGYFVMQGEITIGEMVAFQTLSLHPIPFLSSFVNLSTLYLRISF